VTITDPVLDLLGVQVLASAGKSLAEILADATGEQLRQLMAAAEQVSAAAEREVLRRNAEQERRVCGHDGCVLETGHSGGHEWAVMGR
jgi:hypothetical protein